MVPLHQLNSPWPLENKIGVDQSPAKILMENKLGKPAGLLVVGIQLIHAGVAGLLVKDLGFSRWYEHSLVQSSNLWSNAIAYVWSCCSVHRIWDGIGNATQVYCHVH